MKTFLLPLILLFTMLSANAQSWNIKLNGSLVLKADSEDEVKNTKKVSRASFNKKGHLEINYSGTLQRGWTRSLLIFDETDNELWSKEHVGLNTKISNAVIKKLFAGKKSIRIFIITKPKDPRIGETIRIRRVHLVTLNL